MIQAVFLDMDGTLINSDEGIIPQSAQEAIRLARKNGIKVFIATGRNTLTPGEGGILEGIEFDGYVSLNGQMCYLPDKTVIYRLPLDSGDRDAVISLCEERNTPLLIAEEEHSRMTFINDDVRWLCEGMNTPVYPVNESYDFTGRIVYSITPFWTVEEEAQFSTLLKHSKCLRITPITCDIIPSDGGKHIGIKHMLEYFNIPAENCMTIGDGRNDIDMLHFAGVGVAMGNGCDAAKAAADYVGPAAGEDGILEIFKHFNLI